MNSLYYRISSLAGKSLIKIIEWFICLFIKEPPVLDNSKFEWVPLLEKKQPQIKAEYLALNQPELTPDISEISVEQQKVVEHTRWKFFPMYIYGNPIPENIARCPETTKALQLIPNLTTAFFSILQPGTFIKEHRGAYKGYLRFHLGVDIPEEHEKCGIKILEKTYHWQNAKGIVFDDTFLHEAWNHSPQNRVVLYVDFIRPMPLPFVFISKWLTRLMSASPYIQGVLKNLKQKTGSHKTPSTLG